jgi:hypothetical protein
MAPRATFHQPSYLVPRRESHSLLVSPALSPPGQVPLGGEGPSWGRLRYPAPVRHIAHHIAKAPMCLFRVPCCACAASAAEGGGGELTHHLLSSWGFWWELTTAVTDQRSSPRQSAMHNKQRRHGVNDLDNALGGSYNLPQHGSRPRVSDQQLFNYMIIMPTALLLPLHPTSPSRDRDRQAAKRLRRCSSLPERTASRAH